MLKRYAEFRNVFDIQKINRKKSDILIHMTDGTTKTAQIKSINNANTNYKSRGHSIDRRQIIKYPPDFHSILNRVICGENQQQYILPSINCAKNVIQLIINGDDAKYKPDYYMVINITDCSICRIRICHTDKLLNYLMSNIQLKMKRTCFHLVRNGILYLQKKGGCNSDRSPNDIQAKMCITEDVLNIFTDIHIKPTCTQKTQTKLDVWCLHN